MNKNLKKVLALLLISGTITCSNANAYAFASNSPENIPPISQQDIIKKEHVIIENVGESRFTEDIIKNISNKNNENLILESSDPDVILPIQEQGRFLATGVGKSVITLKNENFSEQFVVEVKETMPVLKNKKLEGQIERSPASREYLTQCVLNKCREMINVTWTPKKDLVGWGSNYIFKANQSQTGIPYSQWTQKDEDGFVSALSNADFYLTVTNNGVTMPRYGNDCSGFVSFAYGLDRENTWSLAAKIDSGYFDSVNLDVLNSGDAVVTNVSGSEHTFIIADRNGSTVTCYEQTPSKCRQTTWTLNKLREKGYRGFRLHDRGGLPNN